MSALRRSQRLYVIKSQHKLPEIGGVRGPVLRPVALSEKSVISMLNRGVAVYEVNPANYKEMTRVNFRNVHTKQYSTRNLGTSKGSGSSTPETHNVYEKVANTYGKSVRGSYGATGESTTSGINTDILTGASDSTKGKGRDLPKGKKTTVVEQSSEAATVKAEKAGTVTEEKETAETTSLRSSDF